jgi:hypothetical protein
MHVLFDKYSMTVTAYMPQWLTPANIARFKYQECVENRTWEEITAQGMDGGDSSFSTGGLSEVVLPDFEVWACWEGHRCLSKVPHVQGDAMCYVYDEVNSRWIPWSVRSDMQQCVA